MSTPIAARCAWCQRVFTPARHDAVTCSQSCRQKRHRASKRPRPVAWTATPALVPDDLGGLQATIPTVAAGIRDTIRSTLDGHGIGWVGCASMWACTCGWRPPITQHAAGIAGREAMLRDHLTDALLEALTSHSLENT